jgi:hypothetical protein
MPTSPGAWASEPNVIGDVWLWRFRGSGAGIDFLAIFPQAGGVQVRWRSRIFRAGVEKFFVRAACNPAVGADAEFFRQVGVADDFKQPGFGRAGEPVEINDQTSKASRFFHSESFCGLSIAHASET